MTAKQRFLDRLRQALVDLPAPSMVEPPPVAYAGGRRGANGFIEAWTALGGSVERIPTDASLAAAVRRWTAGRGTVAVVDHPDLSSVDRDHRWPDCGLPAMAEVGVGVVRGMAAIAATGSVAISAEDNQGRSPSLLPSAAVFVVRVDEIVDTAGDVLRDPQRRGGTDGPPSQLVLVTGPSRSADIELELVVGVHGPAAVHVILIGEDPPRTAGRSADDSSVSTSA